MRNNKPLLFATMGAVGGSIGALVAEIMPKFGKNGVDLALHTALWSGAFTSVLTVALFWAGEIYRRRPRLSLQMIGKSFVTGGVAGFIAGGVAQAVYSVHLDSVALREFVFKPLCWGLMGVLIGWKFSKVIPNLGLTRGVAGGAIGGIAGGAGFVVVSNFVPELLGRMLGIGILGMALGLAIVTVEALFREAALEVIWAPKETTSITLGQSPVTIGGGDDQIYVADLHPTAAKVVLESGKIYYIDTATKQRTELRNGSQLKIGKITIAVKAKT